MTPDLSYLAKTQDLDLTNYVKFYLTDAHAGWIEKPHAAVLVANCPDIFKNVSGGVALTPEFDATFDTRSEALAKGRAAIINEGYESFGVHHEFQPVTLGSDPTQMIAKRERYNTFFGVPFFGVHMNVYSTINNQPHMWLATRAANKKSYPNCFDQIAAGGTVFGDDYLTSIAHEADEEANINSHLMKNVQFIKIIEQQNTGVYGKPFMGYVGIFDLEVPETFTPRSNDGEASGFRRSAPEDAVRLLGDSSRWKIDAAAVAADFAIRHGILNLPQDELATVQSYLSRPLPFDRYSS